MTVITDFQAGRITPSAPDPATENRLEIVMTAALTAPAFAGTHTYRDDLTAPTLVVVLVAPPANLAECGAAIERTVLAGAVTIACEVDTAEDTFAEAVCTVLGAVDDAASRFPDLPVVIVGHAEAGDIASLAAEACGDEIAGLVLTHQHHGAGPVRQAA
ncbi:hypothetical protein F0U44_06500 [Nocardioides humilatus]|uniref:Uncharacterized protein n=1 Tax=Nocardioides humilatus TaxID=2607660 RepID=A0A5B1LMK2_9ACTN|nr:hypothetical protein [Nocardioides humilatus]KAA1421912.1 hypothetical protein F0U44_06500 [Nocardioides humilatus]